MKSIYYIIKFIWQHPLSDGRRINAVFQFIRWQLGITILGYPAVIDWIDETKFLIAKGEAGLTGNLYCGLIEYHEMAFQLHFLTENDAFYDVGSNVGAYTIMAAGVKGCQSYSFEPIPDTFEKLIDQIKLNRIEDLVHPQNCGIADKTGTLNFTTSKNCMNRVSLDPDDKDTKKVSVITLDSLPAPEKTSLVKIDVEGYEKFVIAGGRKFLQNDKVRAVIIELNGSGTQFGVNDNQIDAIIRGFGFHPVQYDPKTRTLGKLTNFNETGNTIYIKDMNEANRRCQTSKEVTIHTVQKRRL